MLLVWFPTFTHAFRTFPTPSEAFPRFSHHLHTSDSCDQQHASMLASSYLLLFFLSLIWPCDDYACDSLRTVYIAGLYHLEPHLDLLLSGFQVSPHHVLICRSLSNLVIWVPAPCLHLALVPASLAPLGHWPLCLSLCYYVLMLFPFQESGAER